MIKPVRIASKPFQHDRQSWRVDVCIRDRSRKVCASISSFQESGHSSILSGTAVSGIPLQSWSSPPKLAEPHYGLSARPNVRKSRSKLTSKSNELNCSLVPESGGLSPVKPSKALKISSGCSSGWPFFSSAVLLGQLLPFWMVAARLC